MSFWTSRPRMLVRIPAESLGNNRLGFRTTPCVSPILSHPRSWHKLCPRRSTSWRGNLRAPAFLSCRTQRSSLQRFAFVISELPREDSRCLLLSGVSGMPAVQSFQLMGLTILLTTVFVLDLRLARQLKTWTRGAFTVVILSGLLMFLATPGKYVDSHPGTLKPSRKEQFIIFAQIALAQRSMPSKMIASYWLRRVKSPVPSRA
jgi:hypothetical protein